MKLLMHICCANCCLFPLKSFSARGIEVRGFWFNPNIHPFTEYRMRLESLRKLQQVWNLDINWVDHYGLKDFVRAVVYREDERCGPCYAMRLEETAKTAKRMGLDGFTTSLLVSPYQNFEMINNVGREIEKRYSIPFYSEDFRPGWREGMDVAKTLGLYRQKYCGCVYSEMERYAGKGRLQRSVTARKQE